MLMPLDAYNEKKIFIRAKTNVFSDHGVLNCDCWRIT